MRSSIYFCIAWGSSGMERMDNKRMQKYITESTFSLNILVRSITSDEFVHWDEGKAQFVVFLFHGSVEENKLDTLLQHDWFVKRKFSTLIHFHLWVEETSLLKGWKMRRLYTVTSILYIYFMVTIVENVIWSHMV